jgi:hypothetical protein
MYKYHGLSSEEMSLARSALFRVCITRDVYTTYLWKKPSKTSRIEDE